MGKKCPDCNEQMDRVTGVDSDRMNWICKECSDNWVYQMSMAEYDDVSEIPYFGD